MPLGGIQEGQMLVLDHSLEFSMCDHLALLLWYEVDPTVAAHGGAKPFNSRPEAKSVNHSTQGRGEGCHIVQEPSTVTQ